MTTQITKYTFDTVIPLEIWDCPGTTTLESLGTPLSQFSALVFVIDIHDLVTPPTVKLVDFAIAAYLEHPSLNVEVFVHKAEALSEDYKLESFRNVQQQVTDQLAYVSEEYEQIPINFHLTSIHDRSIHQAFSHVLHKLVDSLPFLEDLMNVFSTNCGVSKMFLFDTQAQIYVATDAGPVDSQTHSLCIDYLQMLNSFGTLYKSSSASAPRLRSTLPTPLVSSSPSTPAVTSASQTPTMNPLPLSPVSATPSTPTVLSPGAQSPASRSAPAPQPKPKSLFYPSASTTLISSTGGPSTTITYHVITPQLALVTLIPSAIYESRRGLVEYNVVFFREGVQEICEVEEELRRAT